MGKRVTVEQVRDALLKTNGFVSQAAKTLGVAPKTIYEYMNKNPELKEARHDFIESMLDLAENKLFIKISEGDMVAIRYFLSTKGKNRGYRFTDEDFIQGAGEDVIYILPEKNVIDQEIPYKLLEGDEGEE